MAEFQFTEQNGKVFGTLPSWEVKAFPSIEAYRDAYIAEENEIVDELARLENERFVEYPEDYAWIY